MPETNVILDIVLDCCRQHNDISERQIDVSRAADAPLFGVDGVLDSLALVSLVLTVEQGIEEKLGVLVTLADARAASQSSSPFRTAGALTAFAQTLIAEERAGV
jgi:D-alanine--poly(phosphoribitol) ligase subunit 2